ncbi:imidazolonepropionase [Flavobacteriaceae bacterium]|jgi:imidazolonepropionase|nr:imidazolonepropionase [Flavobacteriaceae bacterium]MDA9551070.1 imidazolonepropionase [Flavobacteriaceae bacterium]MDA9849406.1 imidazolonepropionase [Flavobacteriaceae bacterium]
MSQILLINIKNLLQVRELETSYVSGKEMSVIPFIKSAYLLIDNGKIKDFGEMKNSPKNLENFNIVDCKGKMVLPSWCDSHTHIVYAGNRSNEFIDRIKGLSYNEIANNGGGILNSVDILRNTNEEDLLKQSSNRIKEVINQGTGAIEIKSGYGLNLQSEKKMLQVISKIKKQNDIIVKSTFLGAHAFPREFTNNKKEYIDLIVNRMMPEYYEARLLDYVDIFCEKGYFNIEQSESILSRAKELGIKSKIHVNQFNSFGGIKLALKYNALSVDHLEVLTDQDLIDLKGGSTIPVALPTCSYFLGINYTPARKIIDNGLPLAIASDYNPGSSPSGNMNFVVSTACIKMKLTAEEAINAATINGAYAMGISDKVGSITKGKIANLIVTENISSINEIPYSFGSKKISKVILAGKIIN